MNITQLVKMNEQRKEQAEKARHGFRALVFDFDGLIVDTEAPDYESWREVYEAHGGTLLLEEWTQYIGLGAASTPFNPYEHLQSQVPQVLDREAVRSHRRKLYLDRVHAQPILPGVQEYIRDAKRLGLKLAVASSSDCAWVTGHLLRLNLFHDFDVIRCADHVANTKPHPELYLAAVKNLGVLPHEAIAFEDSSHGVSSAKAAGLYAVAIPNAMTHRLPLEHADLRLNSALAGHVHDWNRYCSNDSPPSNQPKERTDKDDRRATGIDAGRGNVFHACPAVGRAWARSGRRTRPGTVPDGHHARWWGGDARARTAGPRRGLRGSGNGTDRRARGRHTRGWHVHVLAQCYRPGRGRQIPLRPCTTGPISGQPLWQSDCGAI